MPLLQTREIEANAYSLYINPLHLGKHSPIGCQLRAVIFDLLFYEFCFRLPGHRPRGLEINNPPTVAVLFDTTSQSRTSSPFRIFAASLMIAEMS